MGSYAASSTMLHPLAQTQRLLLHHHLPRTDVVAFSHLRFKKKGHADSSVALFVCRLGSWVTAESLVPPPLIGRDGLKRDLAALRLNRAVILLDVVLVKSLAGFDGNAATDRRD